MIEALVIMDYNVKFQNQIMISKYDNNYHPLLQICIFHYQTWMIDHHFYYRMGHYQKSYHQFQNYHMEYIDQFLNHVWRIRLMKYFWILFIMWLNVSKEQRVFRLFWNQMLSMCVKCFFSSSVRSLYVTSVGSLKIMKRSLRSSFNLSESWRALKFRCKTNEITGSVSFRLGEFCIVYAKEFDLFSAYWYTFDWISSIAVWTPRKQVEIGFKMMLWNNGVKSIDWLWEWASNSEKYCAVQSRR